MEAIIPKSLGTSIKRLFASVFFRTLGRQRMVDTVKVQLSGEVSGKVSPLKKIVLPGRVVRFYHDGFGNCKAEAELPKLLWGHNGRLLANQDELDESVLKFRSILLRFVKFESWRWVLLDLCWQFQEPRTPDVFQAHQWVRFHGVGKWPTPFNGFKDGISWRGAKRRLTLYDKAKKMHTGAGVLRAELRLAGGELRQVIDENVPLNFAQLWQVFRGELVKLSPVELPEMRKHTFPDIVASLPPEMQSKAILTYQQGRTGRAVREFKRGISIASLRRLPWNWHDQLPDHPPPPVSVEPPRTRHCKPPAHGN